MKKIYTTLIAAFVLLFGINYAFFVSQSEFQILHGMSLIVTAGLGLFFYRIR